MSELENILSGIEERGSVGGPRIISEQHDINQIDYGGEDAIRNAGGRRPSEPWDAREYGMSLAEAQRRWDQAQTPEAREMVIADLRQRAIRRAGLDVSNGRVSVMVAGKAPWHALGILVEEAVRSEDAIRLANIGWEVIKVPHYYKFNGEDKLAPNVYDLIRADTGDFFSIAGPQYQTIQNRDAFNFLDAVLEDFGAKYASAGAVFGGRTVWLLACLPNKSFEVVPGDQIVPYALFQNPHIPGEAAACFPTTERVVCANTLRIASERDRSKGIRIAHRGDMRTKIASAQLALKLTVSNVAKFREQAALMVRLKCDILKFANDVLDQHMDITAKQVKEGFSSWLIEDEKARRLSEENPNLLEEIIQVYDEKVEKRQSVLDEILERYERQQNGIGGIRGTAWSAFNAVTEYADHGRRYRGSTEDRESRRFEQVLYGEQDDLKQSALSVAMAMAN
jgi:phage/plasmid-like protein (TIGR03299 family)